MTTAFAVLPADAVLDNRVTGSQLKLLGLISYYGGNRSRGCWPSYNKLSYQTGLTRRQIMRNIDALCEQGYLSKEPRLRADGSSSSNTLRVIFSDVFVAPEETEEQLAKDSGTAEGSDRHQSLMDSVFPRHPGSDTNVTPPVTPHVTPKKEPNKRNQTKKNNISLAEWEAVNGALRPEMMASWIKQHKLDPNGVWNLIEEFRIDMMSKGKQYTDFKAAFMNYLTKGWLSKTMAQIPARATPGATQQSTRGHSL